MSSRHPSRGRHERGRRRARAVRLPPGATARSRAARSADRRDLVLTVELYVAAARHPALRAVTQTWMARSRQALERRFDAATARGLDALIEGLTLHHALSTDPMTPAQLRHAIHRFLR
ncbi:TetR family transcriptional regulator C-terminal domain-containing protein [Nonomuraea sp. MCN248]|uniref:TetR family transcriptional regulator C-terminal domain-containing protein n=1 Tax=Nonomuraea corallina TaxID=2989783 RepID=A0ABT4S8R8_9ACTN|nr:TetR family transcriptional regulator C-terminal domain-containing protein [Nonomuraea corallina]MDA0633453.1 TetR family transcriptional regulator C-terminal domain-containing protein [Nonomuraea corallina]